MITGIGGAAGYFPGMGFARIIGATVFSSAIAIKPQVLPVTTALVLLVTLAGSIPAIRLIPPPAPGGSAPREVGY